MNSRPDAVGVACLLIVFCRCEGNARYVLLAAFNYAGALLVGATYLLWRMKNARRQVKADG